MVDEINVKQFIGPLIMLGVCMYIIGFFYSRLFRWLPNSIYKMFFGPVTLIGVYIWYSPMHMGFYDLFK